MSHDAWGPVEEMVDAGRRVLAAQPFSELLGAELVSFESLCATGLGTIRAVRDPGDSATP